MNTTEDTYNIRIKHIISPGGNSVPIDSINTNGDYLYVGYVSPHSHNKIISIEELTKTKWRVGWIIDGPNDLRFYTYILEIREETDEYN